MRRMSGVINTLNIDFPRQPTAFLASDSGSVKGAKQALALALDRFRTLATIKQGCLVAIAFSEFTWGTFCQSK